MRYVVIFSTLMFAAPALASTTNWKCTYDSLIRTVEVTSESDPKTAPCRVMYDKQSEDPGNAKALWTARNSYEYCVEKAEGFVEKLSSLGWTCK